MGVDHYPYLTPALVTVAACTFGAYLIWRKGAPPPTPHATEEIVVMNLNRRTDTIEEETAVVANDKKPLQDSNYLQISGRCETSVGVFYESEKTNFPIGDTLKDQEKAEEKNSEDSNGKQEVIESVLALSVNEVSDSESDESINYCKLNVADVPQRIVSKQEVQNYDTNKAINNNNVAAQDSSQCSKFKIKVPDFESNSAINNKTLGLADPEDYISRHEINSADSSQFRGSIEEVQEYCEPNITSNNNNLAASDLTQPSGPTIEISEFKSNLPINNCPLAASDLTQSSGPKIEIPDFESNIPINNRPLADPDMTQSSGPKIEIPEFESNATINKCALKQRAAEVIARTEEVIAQVLTESTWLKREVSDCESHKSTNDCKVTLVDLRQISEPKNLVILQDQDPTSDSKNELNKCESNNNVVILQDLHQSSGSKDHVARCDDIEKVLGFQAKTTQKEKKDFNKMTFNRKRWRRNPMYLALREGNVQVVQSLLRQGASMDFTDRQGQLPTHLAASSGNNELLEMLVGWGYDLSRKDMFGYTPFHRASLAGQTETVKWLHERGGGFIKETSWAGWTPLHLAVMNGHYSTTVQLLQLGANVNAKDKDGWTPMYIAKLYKRVEVMKLLESYGGTL